MGVLGQSNRDRTEEGSGLNESDVAGTDGLEATVACCKDLDKIWSAERTAILIKYVYMI